MTTGSLEGSRRAAARTAGAAYLLSTAAVVSVNFAIFERLLVPGDAPQTARNILAHETLFRVGIAGQLAYCVGVLVVSAALYVVLAAVNPLLALLAAAGRLVHGFTWLLVSLNLFTALRMLSQPDYARALPPAQLPVLARPYLWGFDQYYVGLLFWSLGSAVAAYLWLRSRYVPRALAAFGILASAWAAGCTSALLVFPGFPKVVGLWWFDVPLALFEITLSVLLLVRGVGPPRLARGEP